MHLLQTNLVERPSAQAAEIPTAEFAAGAPALLRKIARYRPRVVCFVGKGIWDTFVRAAAPPDPSPRSDTEFTVRVGMKVREGARGGDSGSDNVALNRWLLENRSRRREPRKEESRSQSIPSCMTYSPTRWCTTRVRLLAR